MARVLIQAGHNCPGGGGGGAPGEADWALDLSGRLRRRLVAAGVAADVVGAWLCNGVVRKPPPQCSQDWELFVALHYDAAIYGPGNNTGCFADRARNDPMGAASDRAIAIWERHYVEATGIPVANQRRNPNTWDYYAFRATTDQTPGIIVEHGIGQGDDHDVLFDQIETVAAADCAAILEFLGVAPHPIPIPIPGEPIVTDQELTEWVFAPLWAAAGVPLNPDAALYKAFLAEYRSGRYRGLPKAAEQAAPDGSGRAWMVFEGGVCVYAPNTPPSWTG
jgi:hypothetical protein